MRMLGRQCRNGSTSWAHRNVSRGEWRLGGLWSSALLGTLVAEGRLIGLEVSPDAAAADCQGEKKHFKEHCKGDTPRRGVEGRGGQEATTLDASGYDPCMSSCVL